MTLGDVGPIRGKAFWCRFGIHRPRWVPFRRVLCIGCGKVY